MINLTPQGIVVTDDLDGERVSGLQVLGEIAAQATFLGQPSRGAAWVHGDES